MAPPTNGSRSRPRRSLMERAQAPLSLKPITSAQPSSRAGQRVRRVPQDENDPGNNDVHQCCAKLECTFQASNDSLAFPVDSSVSSDKRARTSSLESNAKRPAKQLKVKAEKIPPERHIAYEEYAAPLQPAEVLAERHLNVVCSENAIPDKVPAEERSQNSCNSSVAMSAKPTIVRRRPDRSVKLTVKRFEKLKVDDEIASGDDKENTPLEDKENINIVDKQTRQSDSNIIGDKNDLTDCDEDEQGTPFEKYRGRKNFLSVTDFAGLLWCEQQFEYYLAEGGRRETEAMAKGTDIHTELELEVHDIGEVYAPTYEDRWALRMINIRNLITNLISTGKTRELPIIGFVQGFFVYGVIDEVHRLEATNEWQLSDTKTRVVPRVPKVIPSGVRCQLMLYKRMFDELVTNGIDVERMYRALRVDPDKPLSPEFCEQMRDLQPEGNQYDYVRWEEEVMTLQDAVQMAMDALGFMTRSSNELEVSYYHQNTDDAEAKWEHLGALNFPFVDEELNDYVSKGCGFWNGDREPSGVEIEDAWKCGKCDFYDSCTWRIRKHEELMAKTRLVRSLNST